MPARPAESSPLGRALLRLESVRRRSAESAARVRDQFEEWRRRWSAGRTRIADRLRMIDDHLGRLDDAPGELAPAIALNVVGLPDDTVADSRAG